MPPNRNYSQLLEKFKGQRGQIRHSIKDTKAQLSLVNKERTDAEQAQAIIQEVARITQEQLQYHISELVSLAMSSVFDVPYEFEVEFVTKRKQTEVNLWFVRNGVRVHPLSASGGGVVDIAALALRISLLALRTPKSRNILILDEPLKFVSAEYQTKASDMLKMLSKRMGIQIVMATHVPELMDAADKVHTVTMRKGKSLVKGEDQ